MENHYKLITKTKTENDEKMMICSYLPDPIGYIESIRRNILFDRSYYPCNPFIKQMLLLEKKRYFTSNNIKQGNITEKFIDKNQDMIAWLLILDEYEIIMKLSYKFIKKYKQKFKLLTLYNDFEFNLWKIICCYTR